MKIRQGFVSNSSSTSFTMYGLQLEGYNEFEELYGVDLEEYAAEHKLRVLYGDPNSWEHNTYLGLVLAGDFEYSSESDMLDDETKAEFMQRVEDALPEGAEPATWSESYRDG